VDRARRLVRSYAVASGTGELFDADMCTLLIEHTGGNPRAINRFVLEYRRQPDWRHAGARNLLKTILLQQFCPEPYQLFVDSPDTNLLGDFLTYRRFLEAVEVGSGHRWTSWTRRSETSSPVCASCRRRTSRARR
jgi:hypothetical protein